MYEIKTFKLFGHTIWESAREIPEPDPLDFPAAMNHLADLHGVHWHFGTTEGVAERLKADPQYAAYMERVKVSPAKSWSPDSYARTGVAEMEARAKGEAKTRA
jgi:hypothetical protein